EKPVAIGSIQLERCFRSSTKMKQKWDQFSTGYTHPFITLFVTARDATMAERKLYMKRGK
ncbi:MAG: hypothetical protein U9N46_08655, partial [Euryarchaeota archaeon]|nr:hypothetical protein [Euryarchaeota archaeon]